MRITAPAWGAMAIVVLAVCPAIAESSPAATAAVNTKPAAAAKVPAGWRLATTPAPGTAEAIGGYSAGCLQGAIQLPKAGKGYRIARPKRRRSFGHPRLIEYVRQLAASVADHKLGRLWVADLAQVRGGPAPTGHASHQTGLDVDLWYSLDRKARSPKSVVDRAKQQPSRQFGEPVVTLLTLAASSPQVDRIFVNPVVKRAMCQRDGADPAVLNKLRPWWGHDDHFHVRLACPEDSVDCEPQTALPPGDGCGDLDWWFDPAAQAERQTGKATYQAKVGAVAELPARCGVVLESEGGR